jgi:hypothetical protein
MGITDILTYDNSGNIFNDLIESLNNRWKIFRYLERERSKIYHATVVTAYHEINQPLTVMTNAIDLFKIGLKTNDLAPEKIVSNLSFIVRGIKRVQEILEKMKKVEHPKLKAYTKTVPMISLPTEIKTKNQSSENLKLVQEMKVKTGQKNKE